MPTEPSSDPRQVCTFLVEGLLFGVEVTRVQEVIRHQEMTPVPLSPGVVSGLINLRGRIVTALDLRLRLGLSARPAHELPTNVVVRHKEGLVSLLVDEIGDVVEVDEASFEHPPETLAEGARALISGVYKLEPQLLLLLDAELATQVQFQSNDSRRKHG
ncbi:MAG: chemotaxis protein CheW [Deltaproteobacteria bacterium]|nr:chemotaxis protein CheW [Deltaproteobacteria bacterium]